MLRRPGILATKSSRIRQSSRQNVGGEDERCGVDNENHDDSGGESIVEVVVEGGGGGEEEEKGKGVEVLV